MVMATPWSRVHGASDLAAFHLLGNERQHLRLPTDGNGEQRCRHLKRWRGYSMPRLTDRPIPK